MSAGSVFPAVHATPSTTGQANADRGFVELPGPPLRLCYYIQYRYLAYLLRTCITVHGCARPTDTISITTQPTSLPVCLGEAVSPHQTHKGRRRLALLLLTQADSSILSIHSGCGYGPRATSDELRATDYATATAIGAPNGCIAAVPLS